MSWYCPLSSFCYSTYRHCIPFVLLDTISFHYPFHLSYSPFCPLSCVPFIHFSIFNLHYHFPPSTILSFYPLCWISLSPLDISFLSPLEFHSLRLHCIPKTCIAFVTLELHCQKCFRSIGYTLSPLGYICLPSFIIILVTSIRCISFHIGP